MLFVGNGCPLNHPASANLIRGSAANRPQTPIVNHHEVLGVFLVTARPLAWRRSGGGESGPGCDEECVGNGGEARVDNKQYVAKTESSIFKWSLGCISISE